MFLPNSNNLSIAWAETFLELMRPGVKEIGPVIVTVAEFGADSMPVEIPAIRNALDQELTHLKGRTVHDVASTIFPISLWNPELPNHEQALYSRFAAIWPRLRKRSRLNARGVYFQRLIGFDGRDGATINQLEHIGQTFSKGIHRRSALQASIFDPRKDHTSTPMLGFPCLQQVAFAPTSKGLEVTGYYVSQYAFDRAYGNYLGLCWLGKFMAQIFHMKLSRVHCITSHLILDENKSTLLELAVKVGKERAASEDCAVV